MEICWKSVPPGFLPYELGTKAHMSRMCLQVTVDSPNFEIEGTLKNSSRYPYFDISDL